MVRDIKDKRMLEYCYGIRLPYKLELKNCLIWEYLYDPGLDELYKAEMWHSEDRPDLERSFSVEESDMIVCQNGFSKIEEEILGTIDSIIDSIVRKDSAEKQEDKDFLREDQRFRIYVKESILTFTFCLDRQGRLCCEDDPNICMVVILDYNTEINGHKISVRSLFQNLGLGDPEELERITIPKVNADEFEFDEDEDEDEDEGFVY